MSQRCVNFAGCEKHDDWFLAKMLRSVFLVRTAVQPKVAWKDVEQDEFDIYIVLCFICRNVLTLVKYALGNVRVSTTRQTLARRQ